MPDIVLIAPEIPQNTGTIGRLCVCTNTRLHLIKPLGFSLDKSQIRRAGLDYWQYLDLHVYESWEDFLQTQQPEHLFFLSTKTEQSLYECHFSARDYLVFGNESSGLPSGFYERYREQLLTIPMSGAHARSHNLANAVAITLYETLRQIHSWGENPLAGRA